jgi:glutathione synthase/RimK-type ligase-like ATP-grasp enzyme
MIAMNTLFVVNHPRHWPFEIPGITAVPVQAYLSDPAYSGNESVKVFNLCKSDRYQGCGYYVSLLAEARGHRPLPDVKTIEDLQSGTDPALLTEKLDDAIQQALKNVSSEIFELDVYFGRDPTNHYDALADQLFKLVQAPLLRLRLERKGVRWRSVGVRALGAGDIPSQHRSFVMQMATEYCTGRRGKASSAERPPAVAILYNADERERPSNEAALQKFREAAKSLGMRVQMINRNDGDRLSEFDALFIRDTTNVNHYTYQFSRRASAEGLVVIDDPDSILKCTNKVYLSELMSRHGIPVPKTLIVHRENVDRINQTLGFPCILKKPDSAFSLGVAKVESEEQLKAKVNQLLEKSELIIAQEFLPTDFDWRVTILDGWPLFVCKYFMAPGHWQIIKHGTEVKVEGAVATLSVGEAPNKVVKTAVEAANLIGEGLYGVDLKQIGDQCYVIEVNDNPNIDAGNEDAILNGALYREVMGVFLKRIQERKRIVSL